MKNKKIILGLLTSSILVSVVSPICISALVRTNNEHLASVNNLLITAKDTNISNVQEKIDAYLKEYMKKTPIPGMAVTVVSEDKSIFSKGYGVESVITNKPFSKDSSILIGSLTKSFTALALTKLEEEGKLSLDDKVVKYLPWFKTLNKDESDKITVKMLLSHTSGIKSKDSHMHEDDINEDASKKIIEELSNTPLERAPGLSYEYSNEGFTVAGLIIEAVSNMSFEDYIDKNILDKLDMKNSTTNPNKLESVNTIFGHLSDINGGLQINKIRPRAYSGAGSLLSCSAEDLSHYLIALLNDGKFNGTQLVSSESIKKLWTPIVKFPVTDEYSMISDEGSVGYGLGWMISNIDKKKSIHHGGSTFGTSSYTIIHPETKTAVSVLFNIANLDYYKYINNTTLAKNLLDIAEGKDIPPIFNSNIKDPYSENFTLPQNLNKKYLGDYESSDGNYEIKITEDEYKNLIIEKKSPLGIDRGILDFASETSANIRNLLIPKSISFITTSDGKVVGLNGFIDAKRKNTSKYDNYENLTLKNENLTFMVPKGLNTTLNNNSFTIKDTLNNLNIKATIYEKNKVNFKDLLKESIKSNKVINEFNEYSETLGGKACLEKSYFIEKNNKEYTKAILSVSYNEKLIFIDAEIATSNATKKITETLLPLIESLK